MSEKKILIADSNEEFRQTLEQVLKASYQVRASGEGNDALLQLERFQPDVLVLDLMLPGLDGISLLQKADKMGIHPRVLATISFVSGYVLHTLEDMGVVYIIMKPCDVYAVADRIDDMLEESADSWHAYRDKSDTISQRLLELGVSTKLLGYNYLHDAIFLLVEKPDQHVMKDLYSAVAAKNNGSASQIERTMRKAIESAWEKRDDSVWREYFKPNEEGMIRKPTNSQFLFCLADRIRLCENEYLAMLTAESR